MKVKYQKSVAGLSARTLELYIVVYLCRLTSTLFRSARRCSIILIRVYETISALFRHVPAVICLLRTSAFFSPAEVVPDFCLQEVSDLWLSIRELLRYEKSAGLAFPPFCSAPPTDVPPKNRVGYLPVDSSGDWVYQLADVLCAPTHTHTHT